MLWRGCGWLGVGEFLSWVFVCVYVCVCVVCVCVCVCARECVCVCVCVQVGVCVRLCELVDMENIEWLCGGCEWFGLSEYVLGVCVCLSVCLWGMAHQQKRAGEHGGHWSMRYGWTVGGLVCYVCVCCCLWGPEHKAQRAGGRGGHWSVRKVEAVCDT